MHPGKVVLPDRSEKHFNAAKIAQQHGVSLVECIIDRPGKAAGRGRKTLSQLRHLWPKVEE